MFVETFIRRLRSHGYLYDIARKLYGFILRVSYKRAARTSFLRFMKTRMREIGGITSKDGGESVLMIVLDCFRYRNTILAGYARETTPFLESFKVKCKAISAAPWTPPSVASMLSGLYPNGHGVDIPAEVKCVEETPPKNMRRDVVTLPEILLYLGYDLYFGIGVEFAECFMRGRVFPHTYYFCWEDAKGEYLLRDFRNWLGKRAERPFFAYLHLTDLHEPLSIPPEEFRHFFGRVDRVRMIAKGFAFRKPESQKGKAFEHYKKNRILLYDNVLRYLDHLIEDLVSFLEKMGLLDSTLIVVTGDHGEEFWEHAELESKYFYDPRGWCGVGHGHNVFNEIIEVPLYMEGAPLKGKKAKDTVSTVDLMPTLLDLLDVEVELTYDGENIFESEGRRVFLSEATSYGYEKKALIAGRYKFLWSGGDGVRWVFDLRRDPLEQKPIVDEELADVFCKALRNLSSRGEKRRIAKILGRLKAK